MTTTSGGNLSIIDENQNIWITPSGIDKGNLKPEHIICATKDGTILGDYKPSMEYPFHKAIYEARPDIKAIVHAHAPALVSFSISHQIPETAITPHYHHLCGKVGYAPYSIPGSDDLGINIANEFSKGMNCIVMENHGAVVGGANMEEAYLRFQALEFCARTHIGANTLGELEAMSNENLLNINASAVKTKKNEKNTNITLSNIENIAQRAFKQEIIAGIGSSLSEKKSENKFHFIDNDLPIWKAKPSLCNSTQSNKHSTKIDNQHLDIHQTIYGLNEKIGAIIIAQSPHIMSYAVSNAAFDIGSIPESWMFLKNTKTLSLTELFRQINSKQSIFYKENALLIIKNQFIISTGKTLLEAFDRLEVAEFSAKSIIQTSGIGKLCPISKQQINDLKEKFGTA